MKRNLPSWATILALLGVIGTALALVTGAISLYQFTAALGGQSSEVTYPPLLTYTPAPTYTPSPTYSPTAVETPAVISTPNSNEVSDLHTEVARLVSDSTDMPQLVGTSVSASVNADKQDTYFQLTLVAVNLNNVNKEMSDLRTLTYGLITAISGALVATLLTLLFGQARGQGRDYKPRRDDDGSQKGI